LFVNDKVYIHEFIDIIGPNRANYMQHMTANFSPMAQEVRNQRCYGVWGVVGSTGRWPQVVNIWEEQGLDGLAASFRHELNHPTLQDPKLATWWTKAAEFRSGGRDRLLAPAPWTRTIDELCRDGTTGEAYAHELIEVPPGTSGEFLELVRDEATNVYGEFGWQLCGAWQTLMINDSECVLLWAIPSWEQWAELEKAGRSHPGLKKWRDRVNAEARPAATVLLVDAPLSPLRIHRQPARSDQTDWKE
jgi:hypothetical protein